MDPQYTVAVLDPRAHTPPRPTEPGRVRVRAWLAAYAWQWFLGRAPQGVGALDVMRRSVNLDATEAEEQRYMAVDPLRADETTRF